MNFEFGDVVLVLFPDSNLRTAKKRPAMVVLADNLNTGLPQTIVAMITSNMSRQGPAFRIALTRASPDFSATGLLSDSVVVTDNLATIRYSEIDKKIGRVPQPEVLKAALRVTFGI